jgi:hypothetical protein
MLEQLKVGDVVMVQCHCHSCSVFGPPDPSEHNGPYIIRAFDGRRVIARTPFGNTTRIWNVIDMVEVRVVGRAQS